MSSNKRATEKFFALRKAGYRGWIDQNGDPVPDGHEVEHVNQLASRGLCKCQKKRAKKAGRR